MSDDDRWPWYDPAVSPPPPRVKVLIQLHNGRVTLGYLTNGKWMIAGRMLPGAIVRRWTLVPPVTE